VEYSVEVEFSDLTIRVLQINYIRSKSSLVNVVNTVDPLWNIRSKFSLVI